MKVESVFFLDQSQQSEMRWSYNSGWRDLYKYSQDSNSDRGRERSQGMMCVWQSEMRWSCNPGWRDLYKYRQDSNSDRERERSQGRMCVWRKEWIVTLRLRFFSCALVRVNIFSRSFRINQRWWDLYSLYNIDLGKLSSCIPAKTLTETLCSTELNCALDSTLFRL